MKKLQKGLLLIISGPSGVGKDTVFREMQLNSNNFYVSVSVTTRKPRVGEIDGLDYYFLSESQFDYLVKGGKFLEYVTYCGYRYGTLYSEIDINAKKGKDIVLIIETQGGLAIKRKWKEYTDNIECLSIYIMPPEFDELKKRLIFRAQDDQESISKRLIRAKEEILDAKFYDYSVINDSVSKCALQILEIINQQKMSLGLI